MPFDAPTIVLMTGVFLIVVAAFLGWCWNEAGREFPGVKLWAVGIALAGVSFALFAFPTFLGMAFATPALGLAFVIIRWGVLQIDGRENNARWPDGIPVAVLFVLEVSDVQSIFRVAPIMLVYALLLTRVAVSMSSVRSLHAKRLARYATLLLGVAAASSLLRALTVPMALDDPESLNVTLAALSIVLVAVAFGGAGITLGALVQREIFLRFAEAQLRLKVLSGLLPICANCKRIRDDAGTWTQMEVYVKAHSEADFSHGICPQCRQQLYPDLSPPG